MKPLILIFLFAAPSFSQSVAPKYIQKIDDEKEVMSINDNFREFADQINSSKVDISSLVTNGSHESIFHSTATISSGTATEFTVNLLKIACPAGFTAVATNRTQGCLQTAEEGSAAWFAALDDCFDTYGGRLPFTAEWYIGMANYPLTDEIDDYEWTADVIPEATSAGTIGSSGITNLSTADVSVSTPYRCWVPR